MSEIGRISGPLLKDNLVRNNVDLAFENDLLYLDVNNMRIGINTAGPTRSLTVDGTTQTTYLIADTNAKIANVILGEDDYISTVVGNLYISGTDIYVPTLDTDNLEFDNNVISSITTDSDIDIEPAGSGILDVYANTTIHGTLSAKQNISLTGNFRLYGNLTFGNQTSDTITFDSEIDQDLKPNANNQYSLGTETPSLLAWQNLYVKDIFVSDFELTNNQISTTPTDQSMYLTGNGTGGVSVQQLFFKNNKISTIASNNPIVFSTESYGSVLIDSTTALKVPVGTNGNRPSLIQGDFRLTTTESRFRGWGTSNITFGGVFSDNRNTYVIPETSRDANDKVINFVINNVSAVTMDSSITTVNRSAGVQIDNIKIKTNTISTTANSSDITLLPSSGNLNIDDITFNANTITNQNSTDNIIISTTGQHGYVVLDNAVGMVIPYGTTIEQPSIKEIGLTRFNTQESYMEIWNGVEWQVAVGPQASISMSDAETIMDVWTLILG